MTNVILCGYRPWANLVFDEISGHKNVNLVFRVYNYEEYTRIENDIPNNVDLILFVGWSWIIPPIITQKHLCLGIHPSDLPNFRGGSPIQNQIIEGITKSKVSLITLSDKIDSGDIWMKEDLTLEGDNMDMIFQNITNSSIKLLNSFFDNYPNIFPKKQILSEGSYRKRRGLEQSRIHIDDFKNHSLLEIYNKVRCLTDPYPNAYLEDELGNQLILTGVKYIPKKHEK